ncbi:MAG: pseudouridine-5'-phosphate glycosidase [Flavobacteriales bacterium]|nr:pseudouridine-5'-phosphate glycosidase [Flavobacteriales bacterium]MDG1780438.1 pseudouridine-5'-phosphate glycosidase [Flavobacteriales bacterium]MDG2245100.1 pseudouridine-5'-phosphate glycosidase [Flavobacteriales bacterium]
MNLKLIEVKAEVAQALKNGVPVVALESTIISHGMPYPQNEETALNVEKEIRLNGAIPATIAVMNGKIKIGLTAEELSLFAQAKDVMKLSRRDLPQALAEKRMGATTVAATMIGAAMAGIEVFVTGGIGGVHRGVEETWDVSADLIELATSPVTVVCAGAKAILDLPKTMEYLETFGVPVVGYKTTELPAFYTRTSGIELGNSVNSAEELARQIATKRQLELEGGVLVMNPIPEAFSMDANAMELIIEEAVNSAKEQSVSGKNLTPFLLNFIKEKTTGESLVSNIELVKNNAKVGAQLAVALAELR